jgi:hypothetical protein
VAKSNGLIHGDYGITTVIQVTDHLINATLDGKTAILDKVRTSTE